MDSILSKHLANAFLLPKNEKLDTSVKNENMIPYHSFKIIDNSYYIKLDKDTIISESKGYWNNKPIVTYKDTQYVILENSNYLVNLNNLSKTENSITPVKTEEPKKVFLQPKKIIQQPKEPVKDKPQIISIPLNGGTASYVPKMAEEDAEEKRVDNKPTDFISALESNKDDPRVKKFFNYHSELAKKEIFAITEKFAQQQMARAMESGGGTNAVQYSNGGTMKGDLIVDGNLNVTGNINGGGGGVGGPSKRVFTVGNGSDNEYVLLHSLGTKDLSITVYDQSDEVVVASLKNISINETKISFTNPIGVDSIKVVILG